MPLLRVKIRQFANAVLDRALERMNRRSRIFTAAFSCLALALSISPRLVVSFLLLLPKSIAARKKIRLGIANSLFQLDYPTEALQYLDKSSQPNPMSTDECLLRTMCLYHGMGRFRDAMALLTGVNERYLEEVRSFGLAESPFRVLESVWVRHIGHTAMIDYVVKLGILEGRQREETILYVPQGSRIANRFLVQQVAAHVRLIERPADLPFSPSAVQALHYDFLGPRMRDQSTAYYWEIAGKTHAQWHRERKAPLFAISAETKARGWAALRALGVPEGAWFVALHVREGTWDKRKPGNHGIRNAEISTYFPAIFEITRKGGWVIRIGDPSMTPLPQLPNVIDYCHSEIRSDWMDIFVLACCRFFVGTNSGPAFVPSMYGVPSVLTNWWPAGERPWQAADIFIPKMLRRLSNDSHLTLSETLREPFSWCYNRRYLADHGHVRLEDDDPEIIRAAVEEMLIRLDGGMTDGADTAELRSRADAIYLAHGVVGMSQLPREFLHRHRVLIA